MKIPYNPKVKSYIRMYMMDEIVYEPLEFKNVTSMLYNELFDSFREISPIQIYQKCSNHKNNNNNNIK